MTLSPAALALEDQERSFNVEALSYVTDIEALWGTASGAERDELLSVLDEMVRILAVLSPDRRERARLLVYRVNQALKLRYLPLV